MSSMLQPGTGPGPKRCGPLIQDLSCDEREHTLPSQPAAAPPDKTVEGPTMLEMMMAAQSAAKQERESDNQKEMKKAGKSFGSGFKKGFFAGGDQKESSAKAAAANANKISPAIPTVRSNAAAASSAVASSIAQEVQENMKRESHPMMQKLQSGGTVLRELPCLLLANLVSKL